MPIMIDLRCTACDHTFEELIDREASAPPCPKCGQETKRLVSLPSPVLFREGWYEHIDRHPIYISSKKQLKNETRKRGLTSIYAEEW